MSFSKRASRWANSALVVTVTSNDFDSFGAHGPLAGVGFQVMTVLHVIALPKSATNVCFSVSETTLPPSSYRLGVHASKLHELFSSRITEALQQSIVAFDKEVCFARGISFPCSLSLSLSLIDDTAVCAPCDDCQLPGYISKDALLHGVEVKSVSRHADTYESTSLGGLYPIGEGAGYAGGIISAAVDDNHSRRPPQRHNRRHRPHKGNPRSYDDLTRRSHDLPPSFLQERSGATSSYY
ncbi:hypothetical protein GW17_00022117 [Ensete ventricosum]|nr:hypothetical protein GW17_00022117 [Ensete ventricosum]RZR97246.1 hypothetical protein BHM03_00026383 [Ensete ventricosum]